VTNHHGRWYPTVAHDRVMVRLSTRSRHESNLVPLVCGRRFGRAVVTWLQNKVPEQSIPVRTGGSLRQVPDVFRSGHLQIDP
jgi:hypothetical protein